MELPLRRGAASALVALGLVLGWGGPAAGQTTQPTSAAAPLFRYTDPAFGFELQLPIGWSYDRTRFQQFKDSIGLLRGFGAEGRRGLQIMVFRSFSMKPFEDWIVDFGKATAELTNSTRVDWETWTLPPRAGAILTYSSLGGALRAGSRATARSHCLCLPFDPQTVWVFVYNGTAESEADQQQLRREFDQLIATLKVHYDPAEAERLAPALERGRKLAEQLRRLGPRARLDDEEHFYEVTIAGKPVGFFQRRISREEYTFSRAAGRRFSKDGIRVRERSWRFAEDGTVRYTRTDLFSSFDLHDELIEHEEVQIPPGAPAAGQLQAPLAPSSQPAAPTPGQPASPAVRPPGEEVVFRTDQVIREKDVLVCSFTTSRDRELPEPGKPLAVGPAYLDLAWVRLLPGVLLSVARDAATGGEQGQDAGAAGGAAEEGAAGSLRPVGEAAEPYAFAIYSSDIRALLSHVIRFLGERKAPGHDERAFAFEVREGFVDAASVVYTDARGVLLRVETGDFVVSRVPRAEIERKYGARRDAARGRFNPGE